MQAAFDMRRSAKLLRVCIVMFGLALVALYWYAGVYHFNVLLRRGWSTWTSVAPDDPDLPIAVRLGLSDQPPAAQAGPFVWHTIVKGFDVGELPVIAAGEEVDRFLLARIDPARFKFVVRYAPAGNKELTDWMDELGAALVINGSYYSTDGRPATPLVSAGVLAGPLHYEARHGAFVASRDLVKIHDLRREDWHDAFRGAQDAVVSYPLLLAQDGSTRVKANPHWLANRSFVAEDRDGKIIFATTKQAFFSLDRLAGFLQAAPLDLTIALNLDGGPVACQGIAIGGFRRDFCGNWELASQPGKLGLLTQASGPSRWPLPIVLAVLPK